jgi:hypothetical protein
MGADELLKSRAGHQYLRISRKPIIQMDFFFVTLEEGAQLAVAALSACKQPHSRLKFGDVALCEYHNLM